MASVLGSPFFLFFTGTSPTFFFLSSTFLMPMASVLGSPFFLFFPRFFSNLGTLAFQWGLALLNSSSTVLTALWSPTLTTTRSLRSILPAAASCLVSSSRVVWCATRCLASRSFASFLSTCTSCTNRPAFLSFFPFSASVLDFLLLSCAMSLVSLWMMCTLAWVIGLLSLIRTSFSPSLVSLPATFLSTTSSSSLASSSSLSPSSPSSLSPSSTSSLSSSSLPFCSFLTPFFSAISVFFSLLFLLTLLFTLSLLTVLFISIIYLFTIIIFAPFLQLPHNFLLGNLSFFSLLFLLTLLTTILLFTLLTTLLLFTLLTTTLHLLFAHLS